MLNAYTQQHSTVSVRFEFELMNHTHHHHPTISFATLGAPLRPPYPTTPLRKLNPKLSSMTIEMEQLAELFKDRRELLTAGLKNELVYELTKLLYFDYHVIERWKVG